MIVAGVLVINLLDYFGIIDFISRWLGKPLARLLNLPPDIASVMLLGFLRKDVSIALLAPFHLNAHQFIIAGIFMVLYAPCIAAFFTLLKESGVRTALTLVAAIFLGALAVASGLNFLFKIYSF
jgi:ferrous iron transport protein B